MEMTRPISTQPSAFTMQGRMGAQDPGVLNPGMQAPGTQNQGMNNPGTQNPGFQGAGFQDSGFQSAGFQNQGFQNQGFQNPGTQPGWSQPSPGFYQIGSPPSLGSSIVSGLFGSFRRLRRRLMVSLGGLVIAGIVTLVYVVFIGGHGGSGGTPPADPKYASVGDCMAGDVNNADSIKAVNCTDKTASYKVVGTALFQSETEFEAAQNPCSAYPSADAAFWEGRAGGHGTVLCLQKING